MPYISQDKREFLDEHIEELYGALCELDDDPKNNAEGNLNYAITKLLRVWYDPNEQGYRAINDSIGLLECIKLEHYNQIAVPYEEQKKNDNGDVQPYLEE